VSKNTDRSAAERDAAGARPGMMSTGSGKVLAIVAGLAGVGLVIAVIALLVLGSFDADPGDVEVRIPEQSEGVTEEPAPAASEAPSGEASNTEVFTFRDIFEPLLQPLPAPVSSPSTDTSETPTVSAGALYLDDIVTEDGVLKAVLVYGSTTYTLGSGEVIPGTPWKVLWVTADSVTMLYGDVQVELVVGQGVVK
jgi:type IV pilus biogenesis protein PilP